MASRLACQSLLAAWESRLQILSATTGRTASIRDEGPLDDGVFLAAPPRHGNAETRPLGECAGEGAANYRLGPYCLDAKARILLQDGEPVPLGERAVSVLLLLVERVGRLVRKDDLIDIAWNGMAVEESNLTVQIAALRRVFAAIPGGRDWIETLPRRGYRFVGPVSLAPIVGVSGAGAPVAGISAPDVSAALEPIPAPVPREPVEPVAAAAPLEDDLIAASRHRRRGSVAWAVLAVAALAMLGLALMPRIFAMNKPAVAVLPFQNLGGAAADVMASAVSEGLAGGMSRIRNIRTVETRWSATTVPDARDLKAVARDSGARFLVTGTLLASADKQGSGKWDIAARLIDAREGTTEWAGDFVVTGDAADPARVISQLVGLVGDPIATRISGLLNQDREDGPAAAQVQALINQARQFTEQNARDRSLAAEELFQRALALDPDNVVAKIHFARTRISAFLNGWYAADEGAMKMADAAAMLGAALKAKPTYLPGLDANCIYMRAVDRFLDALAACDAVLAINPWSVRAIKEMGLDQMILGRFEEALASFAKADRLDAFHGMRWTWLEGAGLVALLLDRNEEAVSWLTRAIAAAPGTGRSLALLAAADERLGRHGEATAVLAKFRERRPDATLGAMFPANRKGNPHYVEAMQRLRPPLAEAGLPP